jgi:hypothetical protein
MNGEGMTKRKRKKRLLQDLWVKEISLGQWEYCDDRGNEWVSFISPERMVEAEQRKKIKLAPKRKSYSNLVVAYAIAFFECEICGAKPTEICKSVEGHPKEWKSVHTERYRLGVLELKKPDRRKLPHKYTDEKWAEIQASNARVARAWKRAKVEKQGKGRKCPRCHEPKYFNEFWLEFPLCMDCVRYLAKPDACEAWRYRELRKELAKDGMVLAHSEQGYMLVALGPMDNVREGWRDAEVVAGPCDITAMEHYVLRWHWDAQVSEDSRSPNQDQEACLRRSERRIFTPYKTL